MRGILISALVAASLLGSTAYWLTKTGGAAQRSTTPGPLPAASPSSAAPQPSATVASPPHAETPSLPSVEPRPPEVPSQERLAQEINRTMSLSPEQQQRVRDVLDLHAKRMAELLASERDDCFAERLAREKRESAADLLSVLTAEQQIAFRDTPLWKSLTAPPPVRVDGR